MDPNVPTFNPDGGGYYDPNDQGDYVGYVGGYDHGASQQYANYDSHDATAVGAGGDDGDALYFDQMQGSGQASQHQYSDPTGEYGDVGVVGAVWVNLVQYLRVGGLFDIPADVKPKTLTVKLSQNGAVKSVQTFNF